MSDTGKKMVRICKNFIENHKTFVSFKIIDQYRVMKKKEATFGNDQISKIRKVTDECTVKVDVVRIKRVWIRFQSTRTEMFRFKRRCSRSFSMTYPTILRRRLESRIWNDERFHWLSVTKKREGRLSRRKLKRLNRKYDTRTIRSRESMNHVLDRYFVSLTGIGRRRIRIQFDCSLSGKKNPDSFKKKRSRGEHDVKTMKIDWLIYLFCRTHTDFWTLRGLTLDYFLLYCVFSNRQLIHGYSVTHP